MIITLNDQLIAEEFKAFDRPIDHLIPSSDRPAWKSNKKYESIGEKDTHNLSHTGIFGLLPRCYSKHLAVTINPHDIWNLVLSQLSTVIAKSPNKYRELFTESENKEMILVESGSSIEIPIDAIISILKEKVKFDTSVILDDFSTDNEMTRYTKNAIFLDMASPYYDYGMFCCGIPRIKIGGTKEDWVNMASRFVDLCRIFMLVDTRWAEDVSHNIDKFIPDENGSFDTEHFKNIFTQKNVGSGSELEIDGWITEFYFDIPSFKKLDNFTNSLASFKYKDVSADREFLTVAGAFDCEEIDGFYELQYSKHTFELVEKEPK